jgi:hypothetical protein
MICADCYVKNPIQTNKGFLITLNDASYLIIESKINQSIINCKDYLQMFDENSLPSLVLEGNTAIL